MRHRTSLFAAAQSTSNAAQSKLSNAAQSTPSDATQNTLSDASHATQSTPSNAVQSITCRCGTEQHSHSRPHSITANSALKHNYRGAHPDTTAENMQTQETQEMWNLSMHENGKLGKRVGQTNTNQTNQKHMQPCLTQHQFDKCHTQQPRIPVASRSLHPVRREPVMASLTFPVKGHRAGHECISKWILLAPACSSRF